ncbi:MAG: ABC transporter permease subunit [Planctomycetota bacterium]
MFFRLCRIELGKTFRRKDLYVSLVLVLIFISAYFFAFTKKPWERDFKRSKSMIYNGLKYYVEKIEKRPFEFMDFINGLFFTGMAVAFSFYVIMPIVASLIGGIQIAGEAKDGTLRAVLIRPVSRTQLLLAKFGVSVLYVAGVIAVYFGVTLWLGVTVYGWDRIIAFNNPFMQVGEGRGAFFIMGPEDALQRLCLVCLLGGYSMLIVVSLSLFLSTLFDSPIVPIVGSLGIYFISYVLGMLSEGYFEHIREYLFTTHMGFWRSLFAKEIPWDAVRKDLLWCTGYIATFLLAALVAFRWKDVKS